MDGSGGKVNWCGMLAGLIMMVFGCRLQARSSRGRGWVSRVGVRLMVKRGSNPGYYKNGLCLFLGVGLKVGWGNIGFVFGFG